MFKRRTITGLLAAASLSPAPLAAQGAKPLSRIAFDPLHEITSSGLNKVYAAAKEPGPNRLGDLLAMANFGTVDIDWPTGKLTLALRDVPGHVRRSQELRFDQLRIAT